MTQPRSRLIRAVPAAWLAVFVALPFLAVLRISLSEVATAQPPYRPVVDWSEGLRGLWSAVGALGFDNYRMLLQDELYLDSVVTSVRLAAVATVLLLLVGYPMAYAMAGLPRGTRNIVVLFVVLPFWTSFLIRVYAWIGILKPEGLLNALLIGIGAIDAPLTILNTETAIMIGLVYSYLPFMVLPLYAALERLDGTLLEAAWDLGATPTRAFWAVTLPLSRPGIVAGALLCFIPMVGEFVIPDLLGGSDTLTIGRTLWSETFSNRDWPMASAVAVVLLAVLVVPIVLLGHLQARREARAGQAARGRP